MSGRRLRGRTGFVWEAGIMAVVLAAAGSAVSGQGARLGPFDGHGDVGSPKIAGSAAYNAVSQEFSLSAGGANMWASATSSASSGSA